jgi:hypothetical protein
MALLPIYKENSLVSLVLNRITRSTLNGSFASVRQRISRLYTHPRPGCFCSPPCRVSIWSLSLRLKRRMAGPILTDEVNLIRANVNV